LVVQNVQKGVFSPRRPGSWDHKMEPVQSLQTVSGREILRSSAYVRRGWLAELSLPGPNSSHAAATKKDPKASVPAG